MTAFKKDGNETIATTDAKFGDQTQRALKHFAIGHEVMPLEVIYAYCDLKIACAKANLAQNILSQKQFDAIIKACHDIGEGKLDDAFPLSIWQSGSGTQTHMNVNEVIANIANVSLDEDERLHPNDHVNAQQSSNDTFPAVMHISLAKILVHNVLPRLIAFKQMIEKKEQAFSGITRIGRTHLQDAVPISLSQSFSAYREQVQFSINRIHDCLTELYALPIGGTAVGTGINTQEGFSDLAITELALNLNIPFSVASNPFAIISSHQALTALSGELANLASNLNKMANDIRLLGSGPRAGIGELILPSNEPGSSIMPGKVNPTQCEALSQVCLQVMANHQLVLMCNSQGHLELNTYNPVMIYNLIQSCTLLHDSIISFDQHLLRGLKANEKTIEENLQKSLMLITALKPIIGYENCAKIATLAHEEGLTLKAAGLKLGLVTEELFDEHVNPKKMV